MVCAIRIGVSVFIYLYIDVKYRTTFSCFSSGAVAAALNLFFSSVCQSRKPLGEQLTWDHNSTWQRQQQQQ